MARIGSNWNRKLGFFIACAGRLSAFGGGLKIQYSINNIQLESLQSPIIFVQTKISVSILLMDIPCTFSKFGSPCYPNILIA